jgi:hypothetical protein
MKKPICPVCGYFLEFPPSDFNICPSCGTEFGYSDSGHSYDELRWNWFRHGAAWSSTVDKRPKGWDPLFQLLNLGHPASDSIQITEAGIPYFFPMSSDSFQETEGLVAGRATFLVEA